MNIADEISTTENRVANMKFNKNFEMLYFYELNLDTFHNTKEMLENKFEELLKQINN